MRLDLAPEDADEGVIEPESLDRRAAVGEGFQFALDKFGSGREFFARFGFAAKRLETQSQDEAGGGGARGVELRARDTFLGPLGGLGKVAAAVFPQAE